MSMGDGRAERPPEMGRDDAGHPGVTGSGEDSNTRSHIDLTPTFLCRDPVKKV